MPDRLHTHMERLLQQRLESGNRRRLFLKKKGIDFFSNDYLGIATHHCILPSGNGSMGSTGSRLLSGNTTQAMELERYLADFHQSEAALLFNSGYDANVGLISAIANRHSIILYDAYVHASILDGIRLSHAKNAFRFRHNDLPDLRDKLARHGQDHTVLVIVESVYSMEGDQAPLEEILDMLAPYQADLIVDEAHATGVIGPGGCGLVQALGLQDKVLARVHTFGKALGGHGAVITGSQILKEYLINFARSFIYTTALPAQAIEHALHTYEWMRAHPEYREMLQERIAFFNFKKKQSGTGNWLPSNSAIQSLICGNNNAARQLASFLEDNGINVSAILHPTVPPGTERIRICLHAFNTEKEIEYLFNTIASCPIAP